MHTHFRQYGAVLALITTATVSGCAANSVARQTRAVTNADAEAKRALAAEQQIDPSRIPPRSLAVMPFAAPPGDTLLGPLSYAVASMLITDLSTSQRFRMVERMRIDAILRELGQMGAGVTDERTAPRIGRLIGARQILVGNVSVTPQGQLLVQARIVDAIEGTVADLVSATAPLSRLMEAEGVLALRLHEALGVALTPAQRSRVQGRPAPQLAALVAYGRGLQAEARGDVAAASQYFRDAARIDPRFGAERNQATARANTTPITGLDRVLALGVQSVNTIGPARLPEAADTPLANSSLLALLLTIHITP